MPTPEDRLVALLPSVYAAHDQSSLLRRLLDAMAAELADLDAANRRMLLSHWVGYATGAALDGLGSTFGIVRHTLRGGTPESDEAFRRRLRFLVPQFTGGGTVRAVLGSVRTALGLPFDLSELALPVGFADLQREIEGLVRLVEFASTPKTALETTVNEVDEASELILDVTDAGVAAAAPRIEWTFTSGRGSGLSVELLDAGTGVRSLPDLVVEEGAQLVLGSDGGRLVAVVGDLDVSASFTNLDRSTPAMLPDVPAQPSRWKFRAGVGFDVAAFDVNTFDLPVFTVQLIAAIPTRLTFDVQVPYFLQEAVADLQTRYRYAGDILVYESLPPEEIQAVVDGVRAAGVLGRVQFSLNLSESHDQRERLVLSGVQTAREDQASEESLVIGSVNTAAEQHELDEQLALGGVFDIAVFDQGWGYQA